MSPSNEALSGLPGTVTEIGVADRGRAPSPASESWGARKGVRYGALLGGAEVTGLLGTTDAPTVRRHRPADHQRSSKFERHPDSVGPCLRQDVVTIARRSS